MRNFTRLFQPTFSHQTARANALRLALMPHGVSGLGLEELKSTANGRVVNTAVTTTPGMKTLPWALPIGPQRLQTATPKQKTAPQTVVTDVTGGGSPAASGDSSTPFIDDGDPLIITPVEDKAPPAITTSVAQQMAMATAIDWKKWGLIGGAALVLGWFLLKRR